MRRAMERDGRMGEVLREREGREDRVKRDQ